MVTTISDPRKVSEDQFLDSASPEEQLKFLLNYAVLAPSIHNSQPWRFKVTGSEVAVYADRARASPVVDPDDREMVISCGAALFNLRVALRGFGFVPTVYRFPVLNDPDLLATVEMGPRRKPAEDWSRLFHAIKRRHTNRSPFEQRPLPTRDLRLLYEAAATEGARLDAFTDLDARSSLASLIATGDEVQSSSKGFRREVASWLHPSRSGSLDGIPGYANGLRDWLANAGPYVARTFDWGSGKAAHDMQLAEGSPALLVISMDGDGISDWLKAGQALERVLLTATDLGLTASFLNQPVEVGDLRPRVAELFDGVEIPQIILRIGYGAPVRSTPRRPVREVMKRY
ncbi:MAG: nitroreductase [Rhodothermia bacterium]